VFADEYGSTFRPEVNWAYGGLCWPVVSMITGPNEPPRFTDCPAQPIEANLCGVGVDTLHATDPESNPLTFSIVRTTGSGVPVIDAGSGLLMYTPGYPGDVDKTIDVVVMVRDAYHAMGDTCTVHFAITANVPVLHCGAASQSVPMGDTLTKSDISVQACVPVYFELVSGPGRIDSLAGVYFWTTSTADAGMHHVTIRAYNEFGADTCGFDVDVIGTESMEVTISVHERTLQGHYVNLEVTATKGLTPIGGFDFLIAYDPTGLTFQEANPGTLLSQCRWEYFTYRNGGIENCSPNCPSGMVRIVALAETNNGPIHPSCFMSPPPVTLATLTFLVTNDRGFECMFMPVRFFWYDCGDNTIATPSGDTLYLSRKVYDYAGMFVDITDPGYGFPSYFGASDSCLTGDKLKPMRFVDFRNGGVDILCADSIDARGDLNVNGIANEIADAVIYANYFVDGLSAFGNHTEASIAASDINADGMPLTLGDLVFLIRIITGDASPIPGKNGGSVDLVPSGASITYEASEDVGAMLLTLGVKTAVDPVLGDGADMMDLGFSRNNNTMRMLIYKIGTNTIKSGVHTLVTIPGDTISILTAEAVDYFGNQMDATISSPLDVTHAGGSGIPKTYALNQNHPNPFNPSTEIAFDIPRQSDVTLDVFNIMGQKVISLIDRPMAPGSYRATWNGSDASGQKVTSGMYFYRLRAGEFVSTKKMVLLK